MEKVGEAISWNKKRIFIAVFLLFLLIAGAYFFKTRVLSENSLRPTKSVKGVDTQEIAKEPAFEIDIQGAVREKIDHLKKEVSELDVLEIASSSSQVQKILSDIKSLEQYPINQAQEICKKICGL